MKAVVLRKTEDLAVMDVPMPQIAPDQALVRVTHCGICGSDIRYLHGDNPWAKQTLGEKHENPENIILGHEVTGIVEQVGEKCDPALLGRRVAVLAFGTCEQCEYCRRGEEHLCPNTQHLGHGAGWGESEYFYGGMAEYVPVFGRWLFALPDNVTNEEGAILDPLGVAVHGVKLTEAACGDSLLIIGAGAVGALAVTVAKRQGARNVIVVEISDSSLDIARAMRADVTINALDGEVSKAIRDVAGEAGVRAILDTIGAPLQEYLPLLARGGRFVTMTVTSDPQHFSTLMLAGERSIMSSCNFQYPDYDKALTLLEQREIDATRIITHRFSLDDALEAFRVAEDKQHTGAVKVMLVNE